MQDWVTIHTGNRASAESLAKFLADRSIEVWKDERRGPNVAKRGMRLRRVRVCVPPDQLEAARRAQAEWTAPHAARSRREAGRVARIVVLSLVAPAGWVLAFVAELPGVPRPRVEFLFVVWFLSLAVIAQVAERRRRSERVVRSD